MGENQNIKKILSGFIAVAGFVITILSWLFPDPLLSGLISWHSVVILIGVSVFLATGYVLHIFLRNSINSTKSYIIMVLYFATNFCFIWIGSELVRPTVSFNKATASILSDINFQRIIKVSDFKFELAGCEVSGQTLQCHFLITNEIDDRSLKLSHESVLFDNFGDNYKVTYYQMGRKREDKYYGKKELIKNVPLKVGVGFKGVNSKAKRVESLKLLLEHDNGKEWIDFRSVPIKKKS